MKLSSRMFCVMLGASIVAACGGEVMVDGQPVARDSQEDQSASAAAESSSSNDPITALCVSYGSQLSTCECATATFRAGEPDADIYAAIAARFLADDTPGKPGTERWEDAQSAVFAESGRTSETLALNNRFGRGHRDAIKSCGA